ncbi:MAG: hypothetical protein ACXWDO_07885, partial [Bacteroidia bacterium]
GDWWFLGWIITLPVNIISFVYRSFVANDYFPVILIQVVIFIPTFIVLSRIIGKNNKNNFIQNQ